MEVDIVLYSRSSRLDYRWIFLPDYMDSSQEDDEQTNRVKRSFSDRMKSLMSLRNKSGFSQIIALEGKDNLFFMTGPVGCSLIRIVTSSHADAVGRIITSVEGYACPKEEARQFFLNLPYMIDSLKKIPVLRDRILESVPEMDQTMEKTVQLDRYDENLMYLEDDNAILNTLQDQSPCMKALIKDLKTAPCIYELIYGTQPNQFYPMNTGKYYTPSSLNGGKAILPKLVEVDPYTVIDNQDSLCTIKLEIEKESNRFNAVLCAYNLKDELIAQSGSMEITRRGMGLARLRGVQIGMMDEMKKYGYRCGRRGEG